MRCRSARCAAYHEVGHAIVALSEGYDVVSISLFLDDKGSWKGAVNYAPQSFTCGECGASAASRHCGRELSALSDECPGCLAGKRRLGRRLLAGDSATRRLIPSEHDQDDCQDDRCQLGEVYPSRSAARDEAFEQGAVQADSAVRRYLSPIEDLQRRILEHLGDSDHVVIEGKEVKEVFSGALPAPANRAANLESCRN